MKEGVGMPCAPFGAPIMPSPHMTGILSEQISPTGDDRAEMEEPVRLRRADLFCNQCALAINLSFLSLFPRK